MQNQESINESRIVTPIKLGVSKFNNINGVTCYMNSILAILQQLPVFSDYYLTLKFKDALSQNCENIYDTLGTITYNFYKLIHISHMNDNMNITPKTFRKVISQKDFIWGEHQQQDSQEFLNFLIYNLEKEIQKTVEFIPGGNFNTVNKNIKENVEEILATSSLQKSIYKEYSPIKMLFLGQFQKTNECSICKNRSNNFETFESLSLSIPIKNRGDDLVKEFTLNDCLNHYFKTEKLDKMNRLTCNFCYLKNQSNIHSKIWRTPKVLIIQIKRFLVNDFNIPTQKLINKINFPIENLDISDYVNDNSDFKHKSKYNLFAVNYHHSLGNSFSCSYGHYTSIVKNRLDNEWYRFDDNNLSKVNFEEDLIDRNAYLLFYYRTN